MSHKKWLMSKPAYIHQYQFDQNNPISNHPENKITHLKLLNMLRTVCSVAPPALKSILDQSGLKWTVWKSQNERPLLYFRIVHFGRSSFIYDRPLSFIQPLGPYTLDWTILGNLLSMQPKFLWYIFLLFFGRVLLLFLLFSVLTLLQ